MATYAFDLINEAGAIGSVSVGEFLTDADAVRNARHTLRTSFTAVMLDVWREGRRVVRLSRASPIDEQLVEDEGGASGPWNISGSNASDQRLA